MENKVDPRAAKCHQFIWNIILKPNCGSFISRKRKIVKAFKALFVALLLLLLPACLSWFMEKPTFSLKEISVNRISLTDISFLIGIEVQNPNSFDLNLASLEYTVFFNEREVGKGRLDEKVRMAKASSTVVRVPLRADFRTLGDPVRMILAGQDLKYRIEGSAVLKALLSTKTLPFSKTGEFRLKP